MDEEKINQLEIFKPIDLTVRGLELRQKIVKELANFKTIKMKYFLNKKGQINQKKKKKLNILLTKLSLLLDIDADGDPVYKIKKHSDLQWMTNILTFIRKNKSMLQMLKGIMNKQEETQEKKKQEEKKKKKEEKEKEQAVKKSKKIIEAEESEKKREKEKQELQEKQKIQDAKLIINKSEQNQLLEKLDEREEELSNRIRVKIITQSPELVNLPEELEIRVSEELKKLRKEQEEVQEQGAEEMKEAAERDPELDRQMVNNVNNASQNVVVVDENDFEQEIQNDEQQEDQIVELAEPNEEQEQNFDEGIVYNMFQANYDSEDENENEGQMEQGGVEVQVVENEIDEQKEQERGNPQEESLIDGFVGQEETDVFDVDTEIRLILSENTQDQEVIKRLAMLINNIGGLRTGQNRTPEENEIIINLRRILRDTEGGRRLNQRLNIAQTEIESDVVLAESRRIKKEISKIDIFLKNNKQLTHDTLSYNKHLKQAERTGVTPETVLLEEAVEEISNTITRDGISDSLISKIAQMIDLVSSETRDVIFDILRNSPFEFLNPAGIASSVLSRLLGRVIFYGLNLNEAEEQQRINAYRENPVDHQIQGSNRRIINEILKRVRKKPRGGPIEPQIRPNEITDLTEIVVVGGEGEEVKEQERVLERPPPIKRLSMRKAFRKAFRKFGRYHKALKERLKKQSKKQLISLDVDEALEDIVEPVEEIEEEKELERTARQAEDVDIDVELEEAARLAEEFEQRQQQSSLSSLSNLIAPMLAAFAQMGGQQAQEIEMQNFANIKADIARQIIDQGPDRLINYFAVAPRIEQIIPREFPNLGPNANVAIAAAVVAGLYSAYQYYTKEAIKDEDDVSRLPRKEGPMRGDDNKEDVDKPIVPNAEAWLRPEFYMTGTDYFDNMYSRKDIQDENFEWSDFNFVSTMDKTNYIQVDNALSDSIRYMEPLFLPEYQAPIKPPSKRSEILTRSIMTDQIQLDQSFNNVFSGAVNNTDNLSIVQPNNPFDRSWMDNILYHPDGSIL